MKVDYVDGNGFIIFVSVVVLIGVFFRFGLYFDVVGIGVFDNVGNILCCFWFYYGGRFDGYIKIIWFDLLNLVKWVFGKSSEVGLVVGNFLDVLL